MKKKLHEKLHGLLTTLAYKFGYGIGKAIAKHSKKDYYIQNDPNFERDLMIACQMVKIRKIANRIEGSYAYIGFVKDISSKFKIMPLDVSKALQHDFGDLKVYKLVRKLCDLCGDNADIDYIYALFNKYFSINDKYMPYIYEGKDKQFYDLIQEKNTNQLYYYSADHVKVYLEASDDYEYGDIDIDKIDELYSDDEEDND